MTTEHGRAFMPTATVAAVDEPPRGPLGAKGYDEPSVFTAANLLREARRQRGLDRVPVPAVCLLDPDGDVARHLREGGQATRHPGWACYHTDMWITATAGGMAVGVVPCAVGAPFAVLVAEELAASGCALVVSVTSAGMIVPLGAPPYFVLIERALRDEGTSDHYRPPGDWAALAVSLRTALAGALEDLGEPVHRGMSWTTDAPFRETAAAIAAARGLGIHAVEMEAAALYAYADASGRDVVCIAHVTNTMAVDGDDFDKGADDGTARTLALVEVVAVAAGHYSRRPS